MVSCTCTVLSLISMCSHTCGSSRYLLFLQPHRGVLPFVNRITPSWRRNTSLVRHFVHFNWDRWDSKVENLDLWYTEEYCPAFRISECLYHTGFKAHCKIITADFIIEMLHVTKGSCQEGNVGCATQSRHQNIKHASCTRHNIRRSSRS
jgi:hypothetical protein